MLISQANAPVNVFIKIAELIFPCFMIIIVSGHSHTGEIMKRRDFIEKSGCGIAGYYATRFKMPALKYDLPVSPSDFKAIRNDFPAIKKFQAYLDTAFVGLMSNQVKKAHDTFLDERLQFGPFPKNKSILGIWLDKTEEVRKKLALFLGANEKEIAFVLCTGCGSNIALNGINWKKGENAVIDDLEYPTDFHVLNALKKKGVEIRIARNEKGRVTPDKFEAQTDKHTRAYVVSHISYLNGFRHNLRKLADIIHTYGGYLIVDSAQAVGGVKVKVKEEGVDFLSGIPYKWLNGPNGVGFLYVREELIPEIAPDRLGWASTNDFKSLETMESNPLPNNARRYEYGTLSFEGIYALNTVLDYAQRIGIEAIERRNIRLIKRLREGLCEKGVEFYTPENNQAPILSFFTDNEKHIGSKLKEKGIYITARRCGKGQIRISPNYYNNEEDIDIFLKAFSAVSKK